MANQVHIKLLRGTAAKNNSFTGADGEVTINQDSHSLRIHDGVTVGGHGTVYAVSTTDASDTSAKLADMAEGALIVEGTGPIQVHADIKLSSVTGNVLEQKTDGLFASKSSVITADAEETASVLPGLAEGALILEGAGDTIAIETSAKVSAAAGNAIERKVDGIYVESIDVSSASGNAIQRKTDGLFVESIDVSSASGNAIQRKTDGLFVESVKYSKTDPGAGSALATGSLYLVYEE